MSLILVIAGLDPAIHLNGLSVKKMDARIKSGHDAEFWGGRLCVHLSREGRGEERDRAMTKPETPFPRHWRYYIFIKWALIAGAIALALKLINWW